MTQTKTVADLDAALELANKWREASGQDILSAWLPSVPHKANTCLLANAFNKNCSVYYTSIYNDTDAWVDQAIGTPQPWNRPNVEFAMRSGSGYVEFATNEDAELFAETFAFEQIRPGAVRLPDHIALVAYEFDNGAYPKYAESAS